MIDSLQLPSVSSEMVSAVVAGLALIVASVAVMRWVADHRAHARQLAQRDIEARELIRRLRRIEAEQRFTGRFLREFPDLTKELSSQRRYRDVPAVLARVLAQIFRAEQTLVVLRSEMDGEEALVVAAVFPEGGRYKAGIRVPITEGELGFVAQTQRVMDRSDIDTERARTPRLTVPSITEFSPDLVAPLALENLTFGVVALSGIHHMPSHAKEVLRLVCHVGSLALHSVSAFLRVKSAADVDSLTGIFNKRVLTFKLGELLFDAEQRHEALSVFLFDIDHFKNYNDTNGHLAGDDLLRALTTLVSKYVRADDIFGRFGGEEFMIILAGRGASEALVAAEKIRQVIGEEDFPHGEKQPLERLTVSGGIATYPGDGKTSSALLRAADEALYRAKQSGRDRVFTASMQGPAEQDA